MKPISVTAFLFTLEEILLETIPIKDIRSLRFQEVEYFFTYVEKLYPARASEITQKKFANFKKNYHSRKEVWAKDHFPEEIKQALRRTRDQMAEAFPSSSDRVSGCEAQSLGLRSTPTLYSIQKQIDLLWEEIAILKNCIAKSGPETGTSCDPTRTVYRHPKLQGAQHPSGLPPADFKAVLLSVRSKRPFARARQIVALSVLYICSLKISKLLHMEVRHLKILPQFQRSGELLAIPVRYPAIAKELLTWSTLLDSLQTLIGDRPDSTRRCKHLQCLHPAFRAHYSSERPCTRQSLTLELNQILSRFQFSTQHFSTQH